MSTTNGVLEIDVGEDVYAVTFTANGEHLVSGSKKGVQVWRVKDGKRVATMSVQCDAYCVAASNDGGWIAGGTKVGEVVVWNATTYKQAFADGFKSTAILDVDFSPDSTRLVSADGVLHTATIWDIQARRKIQTLVHGKDSECWLLTAKYSPQGDRIATVTHESVRVWNGNDGRLLVTVNVLMKGLRDLFWCKDHLFVKTGDSKIMRIDAATGSTVSEWPAPCRDPFACIALPQHGKFIACSTKKTIAFWDTATHTQFSAIQHTDNIRSVTWALDGQLLAILAARKIIVKDPSTCMLLFLSEAHIDSAALTAWKHGQLKSAEAMLSVAIPTSNNSHHVLASRALVRARLGQWDTALVDAEKSLTIQPSVIGYIAKCVAHVNKGKIRAGCRVLDIAVLRSPDRVSLLLLIKAVVLFMAGEHDYAISRMDDLITNICVDPALYVVRAYMRLLLGNLCMESGDFKRAVRLFEDARINLGNRTCQPLLIVSLISGWGFDDLAVTIQQRLCEALLAVGSTGEAGKSILRLVDQQARMTESIKTWVSDFKYRCRSKLEDLGDSAANAKQYDEAISQYTAVLSLDPAGPQDLLVKRSKALAEKRMWTDALNDANKVIQLDSSSPSGYERKYAALHGMERYDDAITAFETMLSKMSGSSDPGVRAQSRHYVWPGQTKKAIRLSIKNAIHDSPPVLIDTLSGRLCNKSEQATAFELTPAFTRLVASMTTHTDHALIEQVVGKFYRYATFSHTWEGSEPLYEKVIKIVVYDLEGSPTHEKLRMFCKIAREEGFHWAWSDTCCIDKGDHFVLQEALISMFKWYEGSAMTIIFLCDVDRLATLGALMMSIWNSRGWTLQEYHASKVVRIYTRDWTPYLGLTIYNHKESPEIISEMEKATGILAQALVAIRPGLDDIRQKLRLASTRQTTRVEDAAYSLLGIFSMTLPVTYGEGDKALGRLLSQLLTNSGDTSILAWTGSSSSFNSSLPTSIAVFSQPSTSHIPPAIADAEMGIFTAGLRASSLDLTLATRLYDQLDRLPTPFFLGQRMKLPCLAFNIKTMSPFQNGSEPVFRAEVDALGTVEIKTEENLMWLDSICLIHPWIDFLLDRHAARNIVGIASDKDDTPQMREFPLFHSFQDPARTLYANPLEVASLPSPSTLLSMDAQKRVYELVARLRQPFGALLLTSTRRNVAEYRRIATESLITVQVEEITSATLDVLIQGVRLLDVL